MVDRSNYNLEGKTENQIRLAYISFMNDPSATPKQIKDAATSRYSKIGESTVISDIVKDEYAMESIFGLTSSSEVKRVSDVLTEKINVEGIGEGAQKELKNLRSYVNKYVEFLKYCEMQKREVAHKIPYSFEEDEEKPFISKDNFLKITSLLQRKKNIILEGAPGVGKTFLAQKVAYQLIGEIKNENIEMVQFHQSYSYEDFVQGIRPTEQGEFEVKNGVFYDFCQRAKLSNEPFVFIIDEINRGNLSKIFGELMMLIEAGKRDEKYAIRLTYSEKDDEKFYVPDNVYVIGCMNTADRSLAIVDYALRRRFAFYKVQPEFNSAFKDFLSSHIGEQNAAEVIRRVEAVNHIINISPTLGDGLLIGHSYFCQTEGSENFEQWWNDLCEYELFPYIREICFDNDDLCVELCNLLK